MKSKSWIVLDGNRGHCTRCGGVSVWVPGVTMPRAGFREGPLDFWRWWRRFKQAHAQCVVRKVVMRAAVREALEIVARENAELLRRLAK